MLLEIGFIFIFANNAFDSTDEVITSLFPGNQAILLVQSIVGIAVRPFLQNLTATVYLWTFTWMAISIEVLFVPLFKPK